MSSIDNLIKGAIDMHVHFAPDSLQERRQDALELAVSAREMGLRALVLKSREYTTVPLAFLVGKLVPEVRVFGSVTLDNEGGGINPAGVATAARMGAKAVWLPTFSAANSKARVETALGLKLPGTGISVVDAAGKLVPGVKEVLRIVKEHDIILATGHVSPRETFAVIEEARRIGIAKVVVTHPLQSQIMEASLTAGEITELARGGAFIEHCVWGLMPVPFRADPKLIADSVKATGAEHCIMSSDLGQGYNPPAPEGLRMFIAVMLRHGLSEPEIELMVKTNPARLLGLPAS